LELYIGDIKIQFFNDLSDDQKIEIENLIEKIILEINKKLQLHFKDLNSQE